MTCSQWELQVRYQVKDCTKRSSSTSHALSLTPFGPVTGGRPSWSGMRLCVDCVPCGTAELLLFATVCRLRSLRNCEAHAPCGRVQVMLLAERLAFGHFGPFRVLGLGQLLIVGSGLTGRMLYVIN
ncbi:hypothetical protein Tco_0277111 [Tanacetum coccineum]